MRRLNNFAHYKIINIMKLIADSGSTKTDWCVVDGGEVVFRTAGHGINPFQQNDAEVENIVDNEFRSSFDGVERIAEIEFYGAGCRDGMVPRMERLLRKLFVDAVRVEVCSDVLGAARALFGDREGIACILGTGANSCLYDGRRITANVPPLGYILGDEGSGAVLGRQFINALFKGGLPAAMRDEFLSETGLTLADIINKVYREPLANRFLASTSVFIRNHLENKALRCLVVDNFKSFFKRNVNLYGCRDLPVGAVGSIAFYYKSELLEAAEAEGYKVGKVIKSPMEGLVMEGR